MIRHIFPLRAIFPELYERAVKPVAAIPVFFDNKQVSKTSLDEKGEFAIVLPYEVERQIGRGRLRYLPLYDELNRNPDPSKIKIRITGIRLTISNPTKN